jgi:hypothetical protein
VVLLRTNVGEIIDKVASTGVEVVLIVGVGVGEGTERGVGVGDTRVTEVDTVLLANEIEYLPFTGSQVVIGSPDPQAFKLALLRIVVIESAVGLGDCDT